MAWDTAGASPTCPGTVRTYFTQTGPRRQLPAELHRGDGAGCDRSPQADRCPAHRVRRATPSRALRATSSSSSPASSAVAARADLTCRTDGGPSDRTDRRGRRRAVGSLRADGQVGQDGSRRGSAFSSVHVGAGGGGRGSRGAEPGAAAGPGEEPAPAGQAPGTAGAAGERRLHHPPPDGEPEPPPEGEPEPEPPPLAGKGRWRRAGATAASCRGRRASRPTRCPPGLLIRQVPRCRRADCPVVGPEGGDMSVRPMAGPGAAGPP